MIYKRAMTWYESAPLWTLAPNAIKAGTRNAFRHSSRSLSWAADRADRMHASAESDGSGGLRRTATDCDGRRDESQ